MTRKLVCYRPTPGLFQKPL